MIIAFSKHSKKMITSSHKIKGKNCGITVSEVTDLALKELVENIKVPRPDGAIYGLREIFSVLLYAASRGTTIEQAERGLKWGLKDNLIIPEPAKEGIAQIERCYRAAEAEERFVIDIFDGGHIFHFEPALEWFDRWL
ncbi:MAG: hypothetical protein ACUVXI_19000 [bacterium]